jgi:predicted transglutaminase-like cysteine proteinase
MDIGKREHTWKTSKKLMILLPILAASALVWAPSVCKANGEPDMGLLRKVNKQVNEAITYLSDMENYGVENHAVAEPPLRKPKGMPMGKYGDCEDFALTKEKRLREAGWPHHQMRTVAVKVPNRPTLHAVLLVETDKGTLVLDSYDNMIIPQHKLEKRGWEFAVRSGVKRERTATSDAESQAHDEMRRLMLRFDKDGNGRLSMGELGGKKLAK